MTKNTFLYLLLFFTFLTQYISKVFALDLNSIVTKSCVKKSGVIVFVDEEVISMVSFDGAIQKIHINEIDAIFTYGYNENPFSKFDLQNSSYKHLREVFFETDQKKPDLVGWPFKFVEDLIFFYSLDAKMHVISLDQIRKIRKYKGKRIIKRHKHKTVFLEVSDYLKKCNFKKPTKKSNKLILRPVRTFSDQIKVSEFIDNLRNGRHNLDNFEERTYLYARPYLFPKRNRLSIPLFIKTFGLQGDIPFSYIWSTGSDYHFQSNTGLGTQLSENLPYLGPMFLVRSDFKSHFFSGSFEGNILGLSVLLGKFCRV